jgi:hypothetical protein
MPKKSDERVKPVCPDCGGDNVLTVNTSEFEWNGSPSRFPSHDGLSARATSRWLP